MLRPWALLLLLLAIGAPARADGEIRLGEEVLVREGPEDPGVCDHDDVECARLKVKVLSGYTFAPGYISGGVSAAADRDRLDQVAGSARVQLNTVGTAFPGGDMELGQLEVIGHFTPTRFRFRWALLDARAMFFCQDYQDDRVRMPFLGLMSNACRPDAVVGLDAGLLAVQWDTDSNRLLAEWAKLGPAFELFGNGHGYSHLLHSLTLAALVDVRSIAYADLSDQVGSFGQTSMGVGGRLGFLWRSPHWELRLAVRYRIPVVAELGQLEHHEVQSELRMVHNFFLFDGVVSSVGLQLALDYAYSPVDAMGPYASQQRRLGGFTGLLLGWRYESPRI